MTQEQARYQALNSNDADRLINLTEAADVCQREVKRLRAVAIAASAALRLANGRLTRAWEAIDRFDDEVSYATAPVCGACNLNGTIHNCDIDSQYPGIAR